MGVVNNQTDSWKFKFEKLLNNATYDLSPYLNLIVKTRSMSQVLKS
jgi:hypothetical protein